MAYTIRQRAIEVGECYLEGLTSKQIADELGCSETTVRTALKELQIVDFSLYKKVMSCKEKAK